MFGKKKQKKQQDVHNGGQNADSQASQKAKGKNAGVDTLIMGAIVGVAVGSVVGMSLKDKGKEPDKKSAKKLSARDAGDNVTNVEPLPVPSRAPSHSNEKKELLSVAKPKSRLGKLMKRIVLGPEEKLKQEREKSFNTLDGLDEPKKIPHEME